MDEWRYQINQKLKKVCIKVGERKFKEIRQISYKSLTEKTGVDLNMRLANKKSLLKRSGASNTTISRTSKLDIVQDDPQLRKLYEGIVEDLLKSHLSGRTV